MFLILQATVFSMWLAAVDPEHSVLDASLVAAGTETQCWKVHLQEHENKEASAVVRTGAHTSTEHTLDKSS